jgi:hypothetical protein
VKNGVPFKAVFQVESLLEHERFAMSVVFSEFEGNEFDWSGMRWVETD